MTARASRLLKVIFFIGVLLSASLVKGEGTEADLRKFIDQADLIVEGKVKSISDVADRQMRVFAEEDTPLRYGFGKIQQLTVDVAEIYKGTVLKKKSVYIFQRDSKEIAASGQYIFFLKKHHLKDGYFIIDGKGYWRVFDYNGISKVKPSWMINELRPAEFYQDYDSFSGELKKELSELGIIKNLVRK